MIHAGAWSRIQTMDQLTGYVNSKYIQEGCHDQHSPRLQKEFEHAGSYHKLAKQLKINVSYVHNFLKKGSSPGHHTQGP